MTLDILIPSVPNRVERLGVLRCEIEDQIARIPKRNINVITHINKRYIDGGVSIGEARQKLLDSSSSDYICFLDDDDFITENYISSISEALDYDADVITFKQLVHFEKYSCTVNFSIQNEENERTEADKIINRPPWHICPVKRDIAIRSKFPNLNYGEDWAFVSGYLPFIKTEHHIDKILHEYRHGQHSEADKIK